MAKSLGFTLIELLGVLSLVSLMFGLQIVPAYQQWLRNVRLETKARQLLSALQFARSVAIQRHTTVTLCKSHDKLRCGGQWEDGWIITTEAPNSHLPLQPLRYYGGLHPNQTLVWRGARSVANLSFNPMGTAIGYNGHFVLCHKQPGSKIAWIIWVSHTGRPRLEASRNLSQCA